MFGKEGNRREKVRKREKKGKKMEQEGKRVKKGDHLQGNQEKGGVQI